MTVQEVLDYEKILQNNVLKHFWNFHFWILTLANLIKKAVSPTGKYDYRISLISIRGNLTKLVISKLQKFE